MSVLTYKFITVLAPKGLRANVARSSTLKYAETKLLLVYGRYLRRWRLAIDSFAVIHGQPEIIEKSRIQRCPKAAAGLSLPYWEMAAVH